MTTACDNLTSFEHAYKRMAIRYDTPDRKAALMLEDYCSDDVACEVRGLYQEGMSLPVALPARPNPAHFKIPPRPAPDREQVCRRVRDCARKMRPGCARELVTWEQTKVMAVFLRAELRMALANNA